MMQAICPPSHSQSVYASEGMWWEPSIYRFFSRLPVLLFQLVCVSTWYQKCVHLTALRALFTEHDSKCKSAISSGPNFKKSNSFQDWRKKPSGMWSRLWWGVERAVLTTCEFHITLIPACYSPLVLMSSLFRLLFKFYLSHYSLNSSQCFRVSV